MSIVSGDDNNDSAVRAAATAKLGIRSARSQYIPADKCDYMAALATDNK